MQLRAVAWRYSRRLVDRARALLIPRLKGHGKATQRTADSFVIHEDAPHKQFWAGIENPANPNLDLWLERGTRHMTAKPHWRPAMDELSPEYQREMVKAAEDVVRKLLGAE